MVQVQKTKQNNFLHDRKHERGSVNIQLIYKNYKSAIWKNYKKSFAPSLCQRARYSGD